MPAALIWLGTTALAISIGCFPHSLVECPGADPRDDYRVYVVVEADLLDVLLQDDLGVSNEALADVQGKSVESSGEIRYRAERWRGWSNIVVFLSCGLVKAGMLTQGGYVCYKNFDESHS